MRNLLLVLLPLFLCIEMIGAADFEASSEEYLAFAQIPNEATVVKAVSSNKAVIRIPVAGVHERADAASDLLTQALLNEEIEILHENGLFVFARVPDGYCGYIKIADITNDISSVRASGDKVIVKTKTAVVTDLFGREIYRAPMASMFFGNRDGDKFLVTLPQNKLGYIRADDVLFIPRSENIPVGNGVAIAQTARLFINTSYLWGGCSTNGIDCSGLTYIAAKMNGVRIPRDSLPQSETGVYVDLKNAAIGDQLFFGADAGKAKVTHTGIYLGDGNFIHSAANGVVVSNIYSSKHYMSRFMFAKRQALR